MIQGHTAAFSLSLFLSFFFYSPVNQTILCLWPWSIIFLQPPQLILLSGAKQNSNGVLTVRQTSKSHRPNLKKEREKNFSAVTDRGENIKD